jgi:hypothetical protein
MVKGDQCEVTDVSTTRQSPEGKQTTIRLWDGARGICFEARVYRYDPDGKPEEQYKPLELLVSDAAADSGTEVAQQKTNLKAYNAVVNMEEAVKGGIGHSKTKFATFLAASRLFDAAPSAEAPSSPLWPKRPTSKEIYDYVGVSPENSNATGAM